MTTSALLPSPPLSGLGRRLDGLAALLLGLAGGALIGSRRGRTTPVRSAATVGGLALIAAATHRPFLEEVRRAGTRRRRVELTLSLVVQHPVQLVFAFLRNFENFPGFIGALREVRDYGDGRSHWRVSTPAGGTLEWDAITTKYVPNSVIGWRSSPGSPVELNAVVRFVPEGEMTCLTASVTYRVVDGGLRDALAALATPRREHELRAELRRLADYLDVVLAPDGAGE